MISTERQELTSLGVLTVNKTQLYRIKISLQFGRVGSAGVAELLFRVLGDGVQLGRSIAFKIGDADETMYFENDTWLVLSEGLELTFEVMRDSGGNDSGGLIQTVPTGSWNTAPTAMLRIERLA